mgnify:CR=1 FL=1
MENLEIIGDFFGGLGLLLISFGIFWFVSVYDKINTRKKKED